SRLLFRRRAETRERRATWSWREKSGMFSDTGGRSQALASRGAAVERPRGTRDSGAGGGKGRRRRVALGPSGSRRLVGRVQVGGGGVSPGSAIACEPRCATRPRERGWIAENRNRLDCARA